MRPRATMRAALSDPNLLGTVLPGDSWLPWRIVLIAAMGEELTDEERSIWHDLTGREAEPGRPVEEAWCIVGRRGGKTKAAATLSAYLASLCDWSDCLSPGETGRLIYLAQTQRQAGIAMGYASAIYRDVPMLRRQVRGETVESLTLRGGIEIEVRAASFRNLRGVTAIAVVADEIAFWRTDESANPDTEILTALRPALATTGGPLIAISSPYARRGELWRTHRDHWGAAGDPSVLVLRAASCTMNPSLPPAVVERALERDPVAARAEWLAEFRSDIEAFVSLDVVQACTDLGVRARPWAAGVAFSAFVDPSGGSSDSMTLAIAHEEDGVAVLDCLREIRPPFDPSVAVADLCRTLAEYGCRTVVGDRYGAQWVQEQFRIQGVTYHPSDMTRSELYLNLLPAMNSFAVRLLDDERLAGQLVGLERRTARGGRESIDHAPGGHDDLANAAAGALVLATETEPETTLFGSYLGTAHLGRPVEGRASQLFDGPAYIAEQKRRGAWPHGWS